MKPTGNSKNMPKFMRLAGALLFACVFSSSAFGTIAFIDPPIGTVQVGQPFAVNVGINGLDPANDLYDFSFDLQFDPAVFEVLSANDGTIFDYSGNTGLYFDGSIDNVNGFVTFQSGIDLFQGFTGTGGLLGTFTFQPLQPASGSMISVQNMTLETFNAASNLGPPDIDPGTLPVAILNAANTSTTPEPAPSSMVMLAMAEGAALLHRLRHRRS
jgi:hypothetical protein